VDALGARDDLTAGARALERGDWPVARATFEGVLQAGECAEALDGLGLALWFLGETAAGEGTIKPNLPEGMEPRITTRELHYVMQP
jgi:hypothetical protein